MLNCIYGANGSGKNEYMYEKIRDNMSKNIKSFILVPEQLSMDTEREMLSRLGLSAQLMVEVLTFSRLSNLVFSACGPLRLKYIDKAGKLFAVQRALQNVQNDLEYYEKNVHQRGFARLVTDLIGELKRYGATAEKLISAADGAGEAPLSKKLRDIAKIYEEYNRLISGKYSDGEENLLRATENIGKSGLFSGEFFVTGFKDFTPVEHTALSEIMKNASLTVVLTTDTLDKTDGIFASAQRTWARLKETGAVIGETAYMSEEKKLRDNPELIHLKNNYFKYPADIYKEETHKLSLVFAKSSYDEVRSLAEIITALTQNEGYKYKDFLVLARNIDSYSPAVRSIFPDYKINYFLNDKKSLSQSPFVRKLLSAAEILAYGFSYERIMPVVRFGGIGYTQDEADIFENYVLGANITHKYWNSQEDWTYNPDERRIDIDIVNKVKRATVNSVIALDQGIRGRKTAGEICRALLDWARKEKLDGIMSERVDAFNKSGNTAMALEYTRGWNAFSSVISQLENVCGDEPMTYERFYELLRSACDEVKLSIAPPMSDQIAFGDIDTFRSRNAKVVIVLGLTDGVFPKGYSDDGMLTDMERDMLSRLGLELAPTADFKRREEQNLIYNVLCAGRDKLFLSVPLGDKEGKALARSEIADRVCELFPNIKIIENIEASQNYRVIFKELLSALTRVKGEKKRLNPRDRLIYDYFAKEEGLKEKLAEFESSVRNYSPDARLTPEGAEALYGKELMLSVSKLEKYNSCAFSYFLKYGLMAKERLRGGFEANNVGSVLHEALQRYLEELKKQGNNYGEVTREMCKRRVGEIVRETAQNSDSVLYETSPYYRYVAYRLEGVASATAWEIVKFYQSSKYRPYGFEVKIGGDGMFSGMEIDLGNSRAYLEGFIDRIDAAEIDGEKYVNIIDYKSSKKNTDETLEEAGVQIQPLIYAGAACRGLSANPSGMMYIHMNEPMVQFDSAPKEEELEKERRKNIAVQGIILNEEKIIEGMDSRQETGDGYIPSVKTGGLSREQMHARIERAEEKAKETAFRIVSGDISIKPYITKKYNPCTYCEYYGVCGRKRQK